jgi:hypothetical protein
LAANKKFNNSPPLHFISIFQFSENKQQKRGYPERLGQVRIAIKSSKIEALGPPIDSLGCFGQKFERTIFKHISNIFQ